MLDKFWLVNVHFLLLTQLGENFYKAVKADNYKY